MKATVMTTLAVVLLEVMPLKILVLVLTLERPAAGSLLAAVTVVW